MLLVTFFFPFACSFLVAGVVIPCVMHPRPLDAVLRHVRSSASSSLEDEQRYR